VNRNVPSTGEIKLSDTTNVIIPINYIKQANVKMIERLYLLRITNEQDSIILMKDKYINEQQKIIVDFQQRVKEANKINQQINTDLVKQRSKFTTICWGGGGVIIALLIGLLVK
jgi:DNA mismatch repair ATPase MutS